MGYQNLKRSSREKNIMKLFAHIAVFVGLVAGQDATTDMPTTTQQETLPIQEEIIQPNATEHARLHAIWQANHDAAVKAHEEAMAAHQESMIQQQSQVVQELKFAEIARIEAEIAELEAQMKAHEEFMAAFEATHAEWTAEQLAEDARRANGSDWMTQEEQEALLAQLENLDIQLKAAMEDGEDNDA